MPTDTDDHAPRSANDTSLDVASSGSTVRSTPEHDVSSADTDGDACVSWGEEVLIVP